MADSDIEWTDKTWNPVAGCSVISPGCKNCYAMRMAGRLEAMGVAKYNGTTIRAAGRAVWSGKIVLDENSLFQPLGWTKKSRIFVNSMSDLFHEDVPDSFIVSVWNVMREANWHSYQILTKRPERLLEVTSRLRLPKLENVWLGTSVEDRRRVFRIDELRMVPAHIRFLSIEPLLGPLGTLNLTGIDWVIVGGESGPKARKIEENWVLDVLAQCRNSGVPFFFKQWGGTNKKRAGRLLAGQVWDEFPSTANSPR
jgi:protein gp37